MKAVKNRTEMDGARAAHKRDGAAMARFLAWFDRRRRPASSPRSKRRARWRRSAATPASSRTYRFRALPAPGRTAPSCITASRKPQTARSATGELFLIDSGAQYEDGTTDITRTRRGRHPDARKCATVSPACCKGHIAIATRDLSRRARPARSSIRWRGVALWQAGLDFDHGTGHGVGSYLSVHEGPARISKLGTVPLRRGMILSNEPGYYKTGGIRHPHRKSRAGDRRAGAGRRREAGQCVRDADACADRPPPDRDQDAEHQASAPGSTAIMAASAT